MMCTSNVCLWHRSRRYVVFCNRMNVVVTTDDTFLSETLRETEPMKLLLL